jgi:hypothetical protein
VRVIVVNLTLVRALDEEVLGHGHDDAHPGQ